VCFQTDIMISIYFDLFNVRKDLVADRVRQRARSIRSSSTSPPFKSTVSLRTATTRAKNRSNTNSCRRRAKSTSYEATLIGRERAFERVPRLDYLSF